MSNQVGDRYSCTDPHCGCEIEIEHSCSMFASRPRVVETSSTTAATPRTRNFQSEPLADPGDYGSQGATGEGTYGTTGRGDRSATAGGRYDTESTLASESTRESNITITCFCGHPMRQVGEGQRLRAKGASFPER